MGGASRPIGISYQDRTRFFEPIDLGRERSVGYWNICDYCWQGGYYGQQGYADKDGALCVCYGCLAWFDTAFGHESFSMLSEGMEDGRRYFQENPELISAILRAERMTL